MLSRSRQDYLKSLYALAPEGGAVTTSRLAARLGVSPPSVTNMLGALARERLVAYAPRAGARLTPAGGGPALGPGRPPPVFGTFLGRVVRLDLARGHGGARGAQDHRHGRALRGRAPPHCPPAPGAPP